jgi:hypothetical protein
MSETYKYICLLIIFVKSADKLILYIFNKFKSMFDLCMRANVNMNRAILFKPVLTSYGVGRGACDVLGRLTMPKSRTNRSNGFLAKSQDPTSR